MSADAVGAAYDTVAERYTRLFEGELDSRPEERALIDRFVRKAAVLAPARIVDVGCGPGIVLRPMAAGAVAQGATTIGIDASPVMAGLARRRTGEPVLIGTSRSLPFPAGSHSGVLSRHALIHTPPDLLGQSISEFARVLAPGGWVLVTFSAAGEQGHGEPFDHKVTRAHRWSPDVVGSLLESVGFIEITQHDLPHQAGDRFPHVSLLACLGR